MSWILPSDNTQGDGVVALIQQSIEKKVVQDELLEARGAYGSGIDAHPGMHDPQKFPPVFWYRGTVVPPEEMKDVAWSPQCLNSIVYSGRSGYRLPDGRWMGDDEAGTGVDSVGSKERARVEKVYGEIWPNGMEFSSKPNTHKNIITIPQGAAAHCVTYSNEADLRTINNPTYTYDEYVEAFGEEPPLPPGWEYEKADKRELAALLKDVGVNYYPYSNSLTEETWKPLETAFYAGIDVYHNPKATREEIAQAVYDIKYYRALLQLKPGEKSLAQQRREKALKDFWDMLTAAIDNFGKVKDAAEYVPNDKVKKWVGKVNKVESTVKNGKTAYDWFAALFGASKTHTSGEVNPGIHDVSKETVEIILSPLGEDAQEFGGESVVTIEKGISGKAHTNKVADGYIQAGQYDEAIQSMVPSALRQKGR